MRVQPAEAALLSRASRCCGDPYPSPTHSDSMISESVLCHARSSQATATPTSSGPITDHYAFDPFASLLVHQGPTPHKGDISYQQLLPSPALTEPEAASPTSACHASQPSSFAYEYMPGSPEKDHSLEDANKSMYIHAMSENTSHPGWPASQMEEQPPALYPRNPPAARQTRRRTTRNSIKVEEPVRDPSKHVCPQCARSFSRRYNMIIHMKNIHSSVKDKSNVCSFPGCNMRFVRKTDLTRHEQSVHLRSKSFVCQDCSNAFARKDTLKRHQEDGCVMRKVFPPADASGRQNLSIQTEMPVTSATQENQNITAQWAESSPTQITPILAPAPPRRSRNPQSPVYDSLEVSGPYQGDPYGFQRAIVTQGDQTFGYPSATLSLADDRTAYYYSTPQMEDPAASPYLYAPLSSTGYAPTNTRTSNDYVKNEYLSEEQEYPWH